jgi:hypothetical protein
MERAWCMGSERSMIKGAVVYRRRRGSMRGSYSRISRGGTYHREQY